MDNVLPGQAHPLAPVPYSMGEGLRRREGREALGQAEGQPEDPLQATPLPARGHPSLAGKIQTLTHKDFGKQALRPR